MFKQSLNKRQHIFLENFLAFCGGGFNACLNDMSKYTAFRCPNELLRRAKHVADAERRSLSNYIIWLLERDLIQRAARDYEQEKAQKRLHRVSNAG